MEKNTYILAMMRSKWKETVNAISKSIHSNVIYEFAFIYYLIRNNQGLGSAG